MSIAKFFRENKKVIFSLGVGLGLLGGIAGDRVYDAMKNGPKERVAHDKAFAALCQKITKHPKVTIASEDVWLEERDLFKETFHRKQKVGSEIGTRNSDGTFTLSYHEDGKKEEPDGILNPKKGLLLSNGSYSKAFTP